MNFKRSFAVCYRYLLLVKGNGTRIFQLFVWSALDIVLWGFLTKYLDAVGNAGFSFTATLLGAVVLWEFMTRVQQGVSSPFLEDIWSRNLLNFFASPLSASEYIAGLVTSSILTSLVGLVVLTLFAALAFGFSLWTLGLPVLGFLAVLFLFGISFGVIAISVLLRLGPSAEWFVWPIPTVLSPLVGVFYPISILPAWLQPVSNVIPATYVFENLRSIITSGTYSASDFATGMALDLVLLALSCALFFYVHRRAVQSGAIVRYSAESFS